jgi:hypothetical protein
MQAVQAQTEQNVYTAWEDLDEKTQLECIYCELHKDVYGVKARWYTAESVEQARKDVEALQAQGELVWAQERADKEQRAVAVEKRIAELVAMGAGDRETAVRWLHDAEGTGGDSEFLCYCLGLEYGYFK